jgi:hypothetical protein
MRYFGLIGLPKEAYKAKNTETQCPHCKAKSQTGTHGGCGNCRKVKFTWNGKREEKTYEYV